MKPGSHHGSLAIVALVAMCASACGRPPAACPNAHGADANATSTTELTSATAGGPEAPKVGKTQRGGDAGAVEDSPLGETEPGSGEPKRPERPRERRTGFGDWK